MGERIGDQPGGGGEENSLSMPSRPEASTNPRAERAKLSRRIVLDATTGNVSAEAPPPTDKTTCRWGYLCFRCIREPKAP